MWNRMTWDLIKDFWRVLKRQDSESAVCAVIGMTHLFTDRDLQQLKDYFESVLENRKY